MNQVSNNRHTVSYTQKSTSSDLGRKAKDFKVLLNATNMVTL